MSDFNYFLSGETIYFREVRESDINDNYYNWLNDPDVNQYLETRYFPRSKANIQEFVRNMDGKGDEILFAICDKSSDEHIGNIKLGPINWIHRYADISLLIGNKKFWGKGIATESIKLVSLFAFNSLNLNKIKAGAYHKNVGSIKAFLKVGFKKEGNLKRQWIVNGEYLDEVLLGLNIEDFKK